MINMTKKHLSCTSILIGKDASIDGSNILARNEDYYTTYGPKQYIVRPAKDIKITYIFLRLLRLKFPCHRILIGTFVNLVPVN